MSKLYIIPTPIGNLEDITLRAIRILKEVDLICAEDTRVTKKLLTHFGIDKPLVSYHNFNEHEITQNIISQLKIGKTIAVVSDGGTPGISDPGYLLIREAVKEKIPLECLPGPVAFVPALLQSGFPVNSFVFEGFLPHKKGRSTRIKRIAAEARTVILYESPFRVVKLLEELREHLDNERRISISRELTKIYEETVRGKVEELIVHFKKKEPKGEFVIIIEGKNDEE